MPEPVARLLDPRAIHLDARAGDREEAVARCGDALVAIGAVTPAYAETMAERERSISTYVGEGVAIPHGTARGKAEVLRDALAFLRFPEGVDWGGERVHVCVAIAAQGDGHTGVLAELAEILLDGDRAAALRAADDPATVLRLLTPAEDDDVRTGPAGAPAGEGGLG